MPEPHTSLNIKIDAQVNVEHRAVELVERKGLGHPDMLCDRAAEELSIALSRYYREHFGAILHHNVDKVLLVGGQAYAVFGGGAVLNPIYLLLSGRATLMAEGEPVPVGEMAVRHTTEWVAETLPHLTMPGDLIIDFRINPSSPDLVGIFRHRGVPLANDTSFAVAYAPLSELERVVQKAEFTLNSAEMKSRHPQIGEDIKIMGLRNGERIFLTASVAFVSSQTPDLETYQDVKEAIGQELTAMAAEITRHEVFVTVNAADRIDQGSIFLTVTGTSAEQGDDGQVGRGNRANGLITPMRPMTLEATAGKNPVAHVGKLYQVYTQLIVDRICAEIPEVKAVVCTMLSRIASPINEPQATAIRLESVIDERRLHDPVSRIVAEVLADWENIRDGFLERRWSLF